MKIRRRHVFIYVVVITIVCLVIVALSFDKYARNDSINHSNRDTIEKYLSDADKKYLIDNTLNVNLFIKFIKEPDFQLKNYEYYQLVDNAYPQMKPEQVVEKTNELVDNKFTLKYLKSVFEKHEYEVDDLLAFAQLDTSQTGVVAEFNPSANLALANAKYYIAHYKPSNLSLVNKQLTNNKTIYVTKDTNTQLNQLCEKLQLLTNKSCGGLKLKYGYVSYEDAPHVKDAGFQLVPGHNSFQLGTTIMFEKDNNFLKSGSYLWLLENAHKFGFIVRFPQGKEVSTGVSAQPLIFTYIGIDNANELYQGQISLEEKRGIKNE